MARRLNKPIEKVCPKCNTTFTTDSQRRFCSPKCSQSRKYTEKQKLDKSIAKRRAIMADTDEAEEERLRVLKNKIIPPNIPHPDLVLQPGQFVAEDELWTYVNPEDYEDGWG